MKLLTTLLVFTLSFISAYAQIDWNSYEEPDGTFKRLSINPSFTFNTDYDGRFTDVDTDLSTGLTFTSRKVDTFSILNIFSSNGLELGLSKQNDNDARTFASIDPSIDINYSKYLKKRRGVFLNGTLNSRLGLDFRTNAENQFNDFTSIGVGIGTGRIENVSTLYQAIRINNQLSPERSLSQNDLFHLADKMRTFDYNTTLDSRMARIENSAHYLSTMKSLGYQLESFNEIANAIDAFRFERPNFVGSGSRFLLDVKYFFSIDNDVSSYALGLNHSYHKPINHKWHWANNFVTNYQITNEFLTIGNSTTVNYFPTGRTQISIRQNINYIEGFSFFSNSSLNYVLSANVNYFVSPTVSIFGTFSYEFDDITNSQNYTNDLANNIGFRKFLM